MTLDVESCNQRPNPDWLAWPSESLPTSALRDRVEWVQQDAMQATSDTPFLSNISIGFLNSIDMLLLVLLQT